MHAQGVLRERGGGQRDTEKRLEKVPRIIPKDCCRAECSARRYIPGETILLWGRKPRPIQYLL